MMLYINVRIILYVCFVCVCVCVCVCAVAPCLASGEKEQLHLVYQSS